jgi:anti-anti-sigma regulatory factor
MSTHPTDPKNPETPEGADDPATGFGAFGAGETTGFDYAAFEDSLAAMEDEEDQFTDPGMVEERVESRPTIDLQRIPQDDASYDTRELGKYTVVTIRGRVNESFPGDQIGEKLRGPVVFDLTEVDRITSFGVRAWLQMLDLAKMSDAVFVRASPAVVNQVTMMRNFCGPARIHSLVAPYACESCGNEFGVTYEAIADRTALRARNPLLVECPQCRNAAELDEDPWVFFGIDDQLLEEIPDDLAKVLENLGERPNHAPIEKSIVDDTTRVRFNGVVDGNTRFQRAFNGLEGAVVVDLRTATEVDAAGMDGLHDNLTRLDDEVRSVRLEGCPLELARRLQEAPPSEVVRIHSIATTVRSDQRDMSRPVVVDLKRHRAVLKEGKVPDLDIPWRDEPITLLGLDVLQEGARRLEQSSTVQPAPRVPSIPPTSTGASAPSPTMVLPVAALLGAAGVLLFIVALAAFLFLRPDATSNATTAAVMPPPAAATDGTWSTGGVLPPDWSERPYQVDGSTVKVAGIGSGDSVSEALEAARRNALVAALPSIGSRFTPFEPDKLPADGPARAQAEDRWTATAAGLNLTRAEEASRRTASGQHEIAVQYALPQAELDALIASYDATGTFRGLTFVPRPPWAEPGLRVTKRESYLRRGEPGDLLVTVGGKAVTTLPQLDEANEAFKALAPGGKLVFVLDRDGETVTIDFQKPLPVVAPTQAPSLQLPNQ